MKTNIKKTNVILSQIIVGCLLALPVAAVAEDIPWYIGSNQVSLIQSSDYNPAQHTYRQDHFSGFTIGADLYQEKFNELGDMIRSARLYVESLSEQQQKALAKERGVGSIFTQDLKQALINNLVEEKIVLRNKAIIQRMNQRPLVTPKSNQVSSISKSQLLETVSSILLSPAADDVGILKDYFDKRGVIGFCFGRAHYQVNAALSRGLIFESLAKVFVVGKMMPMGFIPVGTWQFHVAGAARAASGEWMAMDNHLPKFTEKTYTVQEWYDYYEKYLDTTDDFNIKMRDGTYEKAQVKALFLYFTEADKFTPSTNAYNKEIAWGMDKNKDLVLDQNEIAYANYFPVVDKFIADSYPNICDPVRYKKSTSSVCSSAEAQHAIAHRQDVINQYRQLRSMDEEKRRYEVGN